MPRRLCRWFGVLVLSVGFRLQAIIYLQLKRSIFTMPKQIQPPLQQQPPQRPPDGHPTPYVVPPAMSRRGRGGQFTSTPHNLYRNGSTAVRWAIQPPCLNRKKLPPPTSDQQRVDDGKQNLRFAKQTICGRKVPSDSDVYFPTIFHTQCDG